MWGVGGVGRVLPVSLPRYTLGGGGGAGSPEAGLSLGSLGGGGLCSCAGTSSLSDSAGARTPRLGEGNVPAPGPQSYLA